MAESSLDSLRQTRAVQVQFRAYELRPEGAPPIPPELQAQYRQRIAAGWPRVQQIARARAKARRSREARAGSAPWTR